jgi:branched-chain amino acid transport system ATP-binding protein
MLCGSNLLKRFAGFIAVDRATVEITRGVITACVGPNGAGKSTLVSLISGSLPLDDGQITLDGVDVTTRSAWARAGLGLRRTFQNTTGIGEMSVLENLELGLWRRRSGAQTPSVVTEGRSHRADEIVELLNLRPYLHEPLNRLPLGVQRKVGIGVAMIGNPLYLLLDEPLAGTEANDRAMLLEAFRELARLDLGLMWIEHDLASVRSTADVLIVVDKGQVIAHGPVESVVSDPIVQSAYWGSTKAP